MEDLNSAHQDLLYFTKVRWLSKGRLLRRFYNLRKEVNESWLCDLAFLINITTHLNDLNTKLQQNDQYANDMYGYIQAFQNKLRLWKAHIQKGDISYFQTLKETGLLPEKKTEFADQFQNVLNEFFNCFQDFKSHEHLFDIFSSPFHTDVDKAPTEIQLELIELQARTDLKGKIHGNESWQFISETS